MANALTMDVEARAKSALSTSPIFDLRELNVEMDGGTLLISGRVSSFYHKQLAQEVVRAVAADVQVVNLTDVE